MSYEPDCGITHRLRSACGHLVSIVNKFEAGDPYEQTLDQLSAVQAALREIELVVVKKELNQNLDILRTSDCDEEKRTAAERVLQLYDLKNKFSTQPKSNSYSVN